MERARGSSVAIRGWGRGRWESMLVWRQRWRLGVERIIFEKFALDAI